MDQIALNDFKTFSNIIKSPDLFHFSEISKFLKFSG